MTTEQALDAISDTCADMTPKQVMSSFKLYQAIASTIDAMHRCEKTGNSFARIHRKTLVNLEDLLPSGAGIDCGTKIDIEKSTGEKIVLRMSYHHMNDCGYYDVWTEHTIKVTASLMFSIDLTISGNNRNNIKEYLLYEYHEALNELTPINAWAMYEPTETQTVPAVKE